MIYLTKENIYRVKNQKQKILSSLNKRIPRKLSQYLWKRSFLNISFPFFFLMEREILQIQENKRSTTSYWRTDTNDRKLKLLPSRYRLWYMLLSSSFFPNLWGSSQQSRPSRILLVRKFNVHQDYSTVLKTEKLS